MAELHQTVNLALEKRSWFESNRSHFPQQLKRGYPMSANGEFSRKRRVRELSPNGLNDLVKITLQRNRDRKKSKPAIGGH